MAIKIDLGFEPFELDFSNGNKETIYFNPADPELGVRLYALKDRLDERIKTMEDIELKPDGTPEKEEDIKVFGKTINIVCEEIDNAFRSEISKTIFKWCSPFAIVNGKRFMVVFIEAIMPEIEKKIEKARKSEEDLINKDYLSKYSK